MAKTEREIALFNSWKALRQRKTISMDELEQLMYQIEKLLMNYQEARYSRDKKTVEIHNLKKQLKECSSNLNKTANTGKEKSQ